MKLKHLFFIGVSSLILIACNSTSNDTTLPNTFTLKESALYPETVTYSSSKETTYIGSYYKGKIVSMDLLGNMRDFIVDDSLVAVVGMTINEEKNYLIVCNSDSNLSLRSSSATLGRLAQIMIYDLNTAKKVASIDLSKLYAGGHFLNDVTLDSAGNIYVTDSFSPVIYKIDTNLKASILVQNELFNGGQGRFGLNGIEYHSDKFLIVGMSNGNLFKVNLDEQTTVSKIELSTKLKSLDGILLLDNNTLLVVSNNLPALSKVTFDEAITKLTTTNNWLTLENSKVITNLKGKFPTTLTHIKNDLYVNFGEFSKLIERNTTFNNFKLQKVEL